MLILPESMTEKQNKFLLFFALEGMKEALKKAKVKEETVRAWMQQEEFLSVMNAMRDSYLAMASLHLKKSSIQLAEKLTDILLDDRHSMCPRDRANLIIKALDTIKNFTMAKDSADLLRKSEEVVSGRSKYEGREIEFDELT